MHRGLLVLALVALLIPPVALAQNPLNLSAFSMELRGELGVPTSAFASRFDLDEGFGLGAAVKYSIARPLSLYGGWDRFEFDGAPGTVGVEVVDRGFRIGAQLGIPEPAGPVSPFMTAGAIFNRATLEVRDTSGTWEVDGDRSTGFEVGAGITIPLFRGVWLVPEGRFRSRASSWEAEVLDHSDVRITYVGLNVGVVIRLPRPSTATLTRSTRPPSSVNLAYPPHRADPPNYP